MDIIKNIKEKNIVGIAKQVKKALAECALTQLAEYKVEVAASMGIQQNEETATGQCAFDLDVPYGDKKSAKTADKEPADPAKIGEQTDICSPFDTDVAYGDKKTKSEAVKESALSKFRNKRK